MPVYLDGTIPDDVVEIFSPPRLVPQCVKRGMRASLSVDVKTGYNSLRPEVQRMINVEIEVEEPEVEELLEEPDVADVAEPLGLCS